MTFWTRHLGFLRTILRTSIFALEILIVTFGLNVQDPSLMLPTGGSCKLLNKLDQAHGSPTAPWRWKRKSKEKRCRLGKMAIGSYHGD